MCRKWRFGVTFSSLLGRFVACVMPPLPSSPHLEETVPIWPPCPSMMGLGLLGNGLNFTCLQCSYNNTLLPYNPFTSCYVTRRPSQSQLGHLSNKVNAKPPLLPPPYGDSWDWADPLHHPHWLSQEMDWHWNRPRLRRRKIERWMRSGSSAPGLPILKSMTVSERRRKNGFPPGLSWVMHLLIDWFHVYNQCAALYKSGRWPEAVALVCTTGTCHSLCIKGNPQRVEPSSVILQQGPKRGLWVIVLLFDWYLFLCSNSLHNCGRGHN